ncbi:LIC_11090 family protein [Leptospira licerasiae]|uniref:Uncharacterized protein n=1 Tax=Leptospira licerasiae str. MMD4847 TaxID=1049971 RepID=A0ABN0H3L6_9LEPT|nr:hypothetical protein [Leptospira licerasiae]EIE02103.1 hypothetical protein LEP1GSC185_2210 [Leptospira licerasiae serovar Varillal str. VAR 010]EJZ40238.1 hypothetical protein LEP1GSC178_1483 [Leptospira licerasiae str. MMD4847]
MKTITAWILTLIFFPRLLVPAEGSVFEKLFLGNSICHCNHNSSRETHPSEEDEFFRTKTEISKSSGSEKQDRPNCHSAPGSSIHKCACKKENGDRILSQIRIFSYYVIVPHIYIIPAPGSTFEIKDLYSGELSKAHAQKLKRPPKYFS